MSDYIKRYAPSCAQCQGKKPKRNASVDLQCSRNFFSSEVSGIALVGRLIQMEFVSY